MNKKRNEYLRGKKLIGDDYTLPEIMKWFKNEEEGYANLGAKNRESYNYVYHELNKLVCFKYLENIKYKNVLGIGSAYGDEFIPIINKLGNITIIDPSDSFSIVNNILNVPCKYIKPNVNGDLPFDDNSFDLIICFGVLHHIPNVSHVMDECFRVLNKNGIMLLREPIVSMGDWSFPRNGLTKNERGIPYQMFNNIVTKSGFCIKKRSVCDFPVVVKIFNTLGIPPFLNYYATKLDLFLSKLFFWNINYHPKSFFQKFRPASLALVLFKK